MENGDAVEIHYNTKEINVMVSDEVLAARMADWEAPPHQDRQDGIGGLCDRRVV